MPGAAVASKALIVEEAQRSGRAAETGAAGVASARRVLDASLGTESTAAVERHQDAVVGPFRADAPAVTDDD